MAAKRQAVGPVASSRNMQGIESVLGGWHHAVDGLLEEEKVRKITNMFN